MRIAMIGQRGVPATFGGIEHHVEQLGHALVERGHEVTVFCRRNYTSPAAGHTYRGMTLQRVPTVGQKHLEAMIHSGASAGWSTLGNFDVVHFHAIGPGAFTPLVRFASRAKVVQTIHGLDHLRGKWGAKSQKLLSGAAWLSARVPDATIVVSRSLERHYRDHYQRVTHYIPNGVLPKRNTGTSRLAELGLEPGRYILFVGRLVPEKAPDVLLRAFKALDSDVKLVLAGGSSFTDDFVAELSGMAANDPRVVMPGYVYGEQLEQLYTNAAVFVLPSHLEGLPLTLLEALSSDVPVVASAIPPHVEIIRKSTLGAQLVPVGSIAPLNTAIARALARPAEARVQAAKFGETVRRRYAWPSVIDATESLYHRVVEVPRDFETADEDLTNDQTPGSLYLSKSD